MSTRPALAGCVTTEEIAHAKEDIKRPRKIGLCSQATTEASTQTYYSFILDLDLFNFFDVSSAQIQFSFAGFS